MLKGCGIIGLIRMWNYRAGYWYGCYCSRTHMCLCWNGGGQGKVHLVQPKITHVFCFCVFLDRGRCKEQDTAGILFVLLLHPRFTAPTAIQRRLLMADWTLCCVGTVPLDGVPLHQSLFCECRSRTRTNSLVNATENDRLNVCQSVCQSVGRLTH